MFPCCPDNTAQHSIVNLVGHRLLLQQVRILKEEYFQRSCGWKTLPLWPVWRCKAKSLESTWLWRSSMLTLGRALHSAVFPLSGTWRTCIGAQCPASRWHSQEKCPGGTWTVRLELLWCGHSSCPGTMGGLPGGYGASVHSLPSDRSAHGGWPGG